jgi:hypothetical protein
MKYKKILSSLLFENQNKTQLLETIENFFKYNDNAYTYYKKNENEINMIKHKSDKDRTKKEKNILFEHDELKGKAEKEFDNLYNKLLSLKKENQESLFDLYSFIHKKLMNNLELRERIINWEGVYDRYGSYLPSSYKKITSLRLFVETLKDFYNKESDFDLLKELDKIR